MASPHAVDTLLRPPVELWSAAAAAGASAVAQWAPWSLLMPPSMGSAASLMLAAFAAYRLQQGWRVVRYQRSMKRLPGFVMKAGQVPVLAGTRSAFKPATPRRCATGRFRSCRHCAYGSEECPWGSTSRA